MRRLESKVSRGGSSNSFTHSEEQATQSHHSSPPLRPCPRLQAAAQGTSHKSAPNLRLGLCHKWLLKRRPFPFKCLPSGDVLSIVLKIVVRFCFSNNARPIQAHFFFPHTCGRTTTPAFVEPQIARVLLRFFASELNFKVLCMLHVFCHMYVFFESLLCDSSPALF